MINPNSAPVSGGVIDQLDAAQILLDLQRVNEIAQTLAGGLLAEEIAHRVTLGIVQQFDCAFARIWLLDSEQRVLRLVASSGMYTNLNGRFAQVPLGAYKVGKIAQNRVAFLSNNLSDETWVGDRDWAIANHIRGFAGYPLIVNDRVVGVLATFNQQGMAPEFLEVLQILCSISAIALDNALHAQKGNQLAIVPPLPGALVLSDQLASILRDTRLMLVGTERSLPPLVVFGVLQAAEILQQLDCTYCRLTYTQDLVILEAIVPRIADPDKIALMPLASISACLGGKLAIQLQETQRAIQIGLELPNSPTLSTQPSIQIRCTAPILQLAFTQLARLAGFPLGQDQADLTLTDDPAQVNRSQPVIWIQQGAQILPKGIHAIVNLSTTPEQLQQAVAAVLRGEPWGIEAQPLLSDRELEILKLLTQGHRDRDIADQLIISESTVKFHLNNVLAKLKARTRYQAIHQAVVQGWL